MLSRKEFIRVSLEINLFFQRIMKEHLFFIETSLPPVEKELISEADLLKRSFEELLFETVVLANGPISKKALESNEFVTPYTLDAERVTSRLTGASINMDITEAEYKLKSNPDFDYNDWLESSVMDMNIRSKNLLGEVIKFKKKLLNLVLECKVFSFLYPEMLEHDIEEAEFYYEILKSLNQKTLPEKSLCEELNFWNNIMREHGEFIDGMLDPTEKDLKEMADEFTRIFEKLVRECLKVSKRQIIEGSLKATMGIINFKTAGVKGILNCEIRSIIPPLLADHVLREANHYRRLLKIMYD